VACSPAVPSLTGKPLPDTFFFGDSRSVLYHYTDFVTNTTDFIFGAFFIFLLENSDSVLHLKQGTSSGFSF